MASNYDEALGPLMKLAKPLGRDEQRELVASAKTGNQDARDKLVLCWLAFILRTAKRLASNEVPIEDLVQLGVVGVLQSIESFDLDRKSSDGTPIAFGTIAPYLIRQHMLDEIAMRSHVITLKRNDPARRLPSTEEARQRVLQGILALNGRGKLIEGAALRRETTTSLDGDSSVLRNYCEEEALAADTSEEIDMLYEVLADMSETHPQEVGLLTLKMSGLNFSEMAEALDAKSHVMSKEYYEALHILRTKLLQLRDGK